eukprot:120802_1
MIAFSFSYDTNRRDINVDCDESLLVLHTIDSLRGDLDREIESEPVEDECIADESVDSRSTEEETPIVFWIVEGVYKKRNEVKFRTFLIKKNTIRSNKHFVWMV